MKTPPKWGNEKACKDLLDAFEIDDFSKKKREQYDKRIRPPPGNGWNVSSRIV